MSVSQFGFAQTDKSAQNTGTTQLKPATTISPLVILKSDNRFLVLDPKKDEVFDFEAIDPKWIKSITVLKDEKAREAYGDKGQNGVLIIQLVDNYIFAKSALIKFKPQD
jgi:hypothetical protein